MRVLLSATLLFISSYGHAQHILREKYDKLFPNNKHVQIQKLQAQKDSLQTLNDSLNASLLIATEKIVHLKKEVINLKTELFNEQNKAKDNHSVLEKEVVQLRDSIKHISFPVVTCREESVAKKGNTDPVIITTCFWLNYQFVETGTPDYKGRYSWSTEIFRKKGDTLVKISNADLFKSDKISELEKLINARLEEDFKVLRETDKECFSRRRYYPNYKLKDMRIAVSDNSEMSFEVIYGLADVCFAVNAASTSFKIIDLKDFFEK